VFGFVTYLLKLPINILAEIAMVKIITTGSTNGIRAKVNATMNACTALQIAVDITGGQKNIIARIKAITPVIIPRTLVPKKNSTYLIVTSVFKRTPHVFESVLYYREKCFFVKTDLHFLFCTSLLWL
jgi:hypothetical protein